jgi:dihydrofolate synthase/folylpolyglutamate synthase
MDSFEIEKWLEKITGKEIYTPGLSRVANVIDKFDLRPRSKVITIAGTNGKGSVSRLLASTLRQKYSVALFTSPHLVEINERFSLNDKLISNVELEKILKEIQHHNVELTYYEYLFVVFLMWLKKDWPDFIVLEVGLGGRLDATNALDADIAVITSISRDHQEFLGNRFDQILIEKMGIARASHPLITSFDLKYLNELVEQYCRSKGIHWRSVQVSKLFQVTNQNIVKEVIYELKLDLPLIKNGQNVFKKSNKNSFSFYGSHNPDAVRKLVHFLRQEHYNIDKLGYDLLVLSFSHRDKKDLVTMLKMYKSLAPDVVKKIIVTSFNHFKAEKAQVLKELSEENGIEFVEDISTQIKSAKTILCSGSNYFYRDFLKQFNSCDN